jgi:hypothetical protein
VYSVANLELGASQELGVVLAGKQLGEMSGLVQESILQQGAEMLGFSLLFGGKGDVRHGVPPCRSGE